MKKLLQWQERALVALRVKCNGSLFEEAFGDAFNAGSDMAMFRDQWIADAAQNELEGRLILSGFLYIPSSER